MKILLSLRRIPMNANQLARELNLNYRTVMHHIKVLERHGLVSRLGDDYGAPYFISEVLEKNWHLVEEISRRGD